MKPVSLELSKQLKENGYPQEGYFAWTSSKNLGVKIFKNAPGIRFWGENIAVAPTADEILDQIVKDFKYPCDFKIRYYENGIIFEISSFKKGNTGMRLNRTAMKVSKKLSKIWLDIYGHPNMIPENLSDAEALYWLHLKREGLL